MLSIIIILPYFGKFPNYFNLFLKSCAANTTIDWLLVTDQREEDKLAIPNNVKLIHMEFSALQRITRKRYGSYPRIPYDMCKYKVVYHELFCEFVKGYDFWGFCDCDLIFGNLRELITNDILSLHDKISWRGHLTLFRNTEVVNNAYKVELFGCKTFKGCINSSEGVNLFDEVGINKIFYELGLKVYEELPFADLIIRSFNFKCHHNFYPPETNERQIFRWTTDGLFRYFVSNNKVGIEKVAYVHLIKRPMSWDDKSIMDSNSFLIVPNKFIQDEPLTKDNILKFSRKRFYWTYYKRRLNFSFVIGKIKSLFVKQEFDTFERKHKSVRRYIIS